MQLRPRRQRTGMPPACQAGWRRRAPAAVGWQRPAAAQRARSRSASAARSFQAARTSPGQLPARARLTLLRRSCCCRHRHRRHQHHRPGYRPGCRQQLLRPLHHRRPHCLHCWVQLLPEHSLAPLAVRCHRPRWPHPTLVQHLQHLHPPAPVLLLLLLQHLQLVAAALLPGQVAAAPGAAGNSRRRMLTALPGCRQQRARPPRQLQHTSSAQTAAGACWRAGLVPEHAHVQTAGAATLLLLPATSQQPARASPGCGTSRKVSSSTTSQPSSGRTTCCAG